MQYKGKKTDSSWMRANKVIKSVFGGDERSVLSGNWQGDSAVVAMCEAYLDIIATSGADIGDTTVATLCDRWSTTGIPREVWAGYARFDEMHKPDGKQYYVGVHATEIRQGAHQLRRIFRALYESFKMLNDIKQERAPDMGNPGGIANATKGD